MHQVLRNNINTIIILGITDTTQLGMGGITHLLTRYGMSLILNNCGINYDEMVHNTVDLMVVRIIHLQTAHYYTIATLCVP